MEAVLPMNAAQKEGRMHPKKFTLILLMVGMLMLFAGLTSALIVRRAEGNWFNFELPTQFIYSTFSVLISSLTMWLSYRFAKKDDLFQMKILLLVTFILGCSFVLFQYQGWMSLANRGIFMVPAEGAANGMISGSFIIMLVGLHLLHLLGGLIFLLVVWIKGLAHQVHKKNLLSINLCNTYWHFVGFLWIYLYTFLYFATQL
ncbi:MAG: cytochrome oxidase subunit III [Bacteroidetes bacterium]|nr:cytochrome oxidase subunit III [Bacteroidota bacterium]